MNKSIILDGEKVRFIAVDLILHPHVKKNEITYAKQLTGIWKLKKNNYLTNKKKLDYGIKIKKPLLFIHIYLSENKRSHQDVVSFWKTYKNKENDSKRESFLNFYYRYGTGTIGVDKKGIFIAKINDGYNKSKRS